MNVNAAAEALRNAGFTVVLCAAEPPGSVGGVAAMGSERLEAARDGKTAVVTVHRFANGRSAVEAGSDLGSEMSQGRRYFAAGAVLVVVEADDSNFVGSVVDLLAAR